MSFSVEAPTWCLCPPPRARTRPLVHNGGVAQPQIAPARTFGPLVVVWAAAALMGILVGVFAAPEARAAWLLVSLGLSVIVSFAVQLRVGRSQGFIRRTAASVLGALLVLGVISCGYALAAVVPG